MSEDQEDQDRNQDQEQLEFLNVEIGSPAGLRVTMNAKTARELRDAVDAALTRPDAGSLGARSISLGSETPPGLRICEYPDLRFPDRTVLMAIVRGDVYLASYRSPSGRANAMAVVSAAARRSDDARAPGAPSVQTTARDPWYGVASRPPRAPIPAPHPRREELENLRRAVAAIRRLIDDARLAACVRLCDEGCDEVTVRASDLMDALRDDLPPGRSR